MRKLVVSASVIALSMASGGVAVAQHTGHSTDPDPEPTPTAHGTAHAGSMDAPHPGVLGIPMTRHGSGTAWLPDASPMRAAHLRVGGWDVMIHGNLFVGYDHQASDAGDAEVVSQNWVMAMAGHPLGGGMFEGRAMLSLEPLTVGEDGYPLLFQTGETVDGMPLVDRQHPHDLFMELATRYDRELGGGVAFELYGALSGEPALGPAAFPHRPPAMPDPMAPLGHHWLDSTHISFGVLTAGIFTRVAKLEGSWFNGREPDEERYDLDLRTPDSYATRLSINPTHNWSLQASYGFLESPEVLHPEISIQRVTGSATHAVSLGGERSWTSTAAVGFNLPSAGITTHAVLAESALDLGHFGVTFVRAEHLIKAGEDFDLPESMEDTELSIAAMALGHVHPIAEIGGAETALGVRGSIAYGPEELETRYGTRTPVGVMAYVQVQPTLMH
jgi:hypothetical protein